MPDCNSTEQSCLRAARGATLVVAALMLALSLGACGKKPNQVDPPPGVDPDYYPHTYPDPGTDNP